MTFEPKFVEDEITGMKEMSLEEYAKLTKEQKQELDRNYWRFGGYITGKFMFEEMTAEEKKHFANEEMVVY